jgi:hypothetical protein
MPRQRILTETDMARLLRVHESDVLGAFDRGELPGFEIGRGRLRCTEPAFFDWIEQRSREPSSVAGKRDAADRAEELYAAEGDLDAPFDGLATGALTSLVGQTFSTPDRRRSRTFRLDAVDRQRPGLQITPLESVNADPVWIRADAVNRCLLFLQRFVATDEPTPIQASQNNPGPLARFTRRGNGGVRCLHYLLPLLERCELVLIDGDTRPNTVKLLSSDVHRKARRHG